MLTRDKCVRLASHRCSSGILRCRLLAASLVNWSAISFPSIPLWAGTQKIITSLSRATRQEHTSMAALAQHWPGLDKSVLMLWIAAWESAKIVQWWPEPCALSNALSAW